MRATEAPEQAVGKTAGKRSDIWSFGVVLREMLSGRMLFRGETVSEAMADVMRAEPPRRMASGFCSTSPLGRREK